MESDNGNRTVSPISLDGRFVRLRPITQADYGFLWQCRWSPEILPLWMSGRTLPSFEQYVRELESGLSGHLLTQLLIETSDATRPIGFVIAYDYSPQDRYTFFNIALMPDYAHLAWGAEATLLFLDYLFAYFDLRKVCMDIYDFNHEALALLMRSGAPTEGRFRGQRYYQGGYHDVIRLGLLQEEWAAGRDMLVSLLTSPPSQGDTPVAEVTSGDGEAADGGVAAGTLTEPAGDTASKPAPSSSRSTGVRGRRRSRSERQDGISSAEGTDPE